MTEPQAILDQTSFRAIAELAYRESGLTLIEEKTTMIQSRLRHRLRALKLSDFADYCSFVESEDGRSERKQLISALTTNVSHFFRENHHFDALCDHVSTAMPKLRRGGRMRIWSAGCSNGQEAVSAVIRLLQQFPDIADLDLRVLATDIDPEVVRFARQGTYSRKYLNGVSDSILKQYFRPASNLEGMDTFTVGPDVKKLVQFNELNLLAPWPMKGQFDAIFCRNVVIYFDIVTQTGLWSRFREALKPDGVLFLGHSERIANPAAFGFLCSGPTAYRQMLS